MRQLLRSSALALAVTLSISSTAAPARAVTVGVAPADTTVYLGDEFALRIATGAFADLKGFDLRFSFDPAKLEFLGADAGDVLTGTGRPYADYVVVTAGAGADSILYDAAMLDGSTAGPGILVSFRFRALRVGDTPILCGGADFRDSGNDVTLPDCTGGLVHILSATPAQAASWGRVKTIYR